MDTAATFPTDALRQEVPAAARYLGVDIANPLQLANLAAVAITQLAWRNGPVELWHSASPSRISDTEMMRANAATTRVVRGHLPNDVVARLATRPTDILGAVRDALTDPGRRLPDGRTVSELASGAEAFEMYTEQVRAFFDRCGKLVDRLGSHGVVGALACYAAAACWKWWLTPGWPSMVDKIMNLLEGQPADQTASLGRLAGLATHPRNGLDLTPIRQLLVTGPDQLSAEEARYCRVASLGARLPQDHGLSPRSRRLLPPAHRHLVSYLEFPTETFRKRLERQGRIPWPTGVHQRRGIANHDSDPAPSRA